MLRKIAIICLALTFLATGGIALAWRRAHLWEKQIRNLELFKSYGRMLDSYHDTIGHYPYRLSILDAEPSILHYPVGQDLWGYPLRYESDGTGYVLVSYGKDGRPALADYWALRNQAHGAATNICLKWNADQILSDVGWHQSCGK